MELSGSNIKKVLTFSQKKAFLIFPEVESSTFQPRLKKIKKSNPRKTSYASGNGNPEKCLMFQETETLKKPLIFQEVTCKA